MTLAVDTRTSTPSNRTFTWWGGGSTGNDETRVLRVNDPLLENTVVLPHWQVLNRPLRINDGELTVNIELVLQGMTRNYRVPVEYSGLLKDAGPHADRKASMFISGGLLLLAMFVLWMSVAWTGWGTTPTLSIVLAASIFGFNTVANYRRKAGGWGWVRRTFAVLGNMTGVFALCFGGALAIWSHAMTVLDAVGLWLK